MEKKEHAQILAAQIQPLIMFIDGLADSLEQEDIDLLKESKATLLQHIIKQESAMTLTLAFGFNPDTTEERYKAKTLDALIKLLEIRKEYKAALIEKAEEQKKIEQNRAEIMNIFGNL